MSDELEALRRQIKRLESIIEDHEFRLQDLQNRMPKTLHERLDQLTPAEQEAASKAEASRQQRPF